VGPQNPKDIARDLTGLAGELAALKADARHWLTDPEYASLHLRLENAHAAVEAALVEGAAGRGRGAVTAGPIPRLLPCRNTA
jgi:hypothetical protein